MKALVTGAAGFVGSTLTDQLLRHGHEVIGVDCLTDYYDVVQKKANLDDLLLEPRCELLYHDLTDHAVLSRLHEVDVLFHLAGQPGVRLSWDANFPVYVQQNVQTTQVLLEAAKRAGVPRVVYASSSSAYGTQSTFPVSEAAVPHPYSPYGVTKLAGEHLCSLYAENYGLSTVSLRYFTVYGPRQRPDMAFSKFSRNALAGRPLTLTGDGTAVRDFTFVDDVVAATIAAGEADVEPGRMYNVCGTESVTVNGAIDLLSDALDCEVQVERTPALPGDVPQTGGTSTRAQTELGWNAQVSLAEGLRRQVSWERSRL